jgi:propanediol dehydratase large subunit
MRWRKVSSLDVEQAIQNPGFIRKDADGMINAWMKVSGKFLRTTYVEDGDEIVVISAVLKAKPTKGVNL